MVWGLIRDVHISLDMTSDGESNSQFGTSVAIDKNIAIIGAPNHDPNGVYRAGSAYVFQYNQTNESWMEIEKLTASDTDPEDRFGYTVDIYDELAIVGALNDESEEYKSIYTILFGCSITFIFIPLICNLLQLHTELSKWLIDPILTRTESPMWILSFMRLLYAVSIISGSLFNAVALHNFGMGLPRYHRKIFANKRFFSVVLLEVCIYAVCNMQYAICDMQVYYQKKIRIYLNY